MKKYSIQLLLFLVISCPTAFAQITIAPTSLFVESSSKFGTYMVINGSNERQEISINFFFGYSQTDESGERKLIVRDSLLEKNYSISNQIRAFPQNFILEPNQRQVVRIRVNAPNSIPDGTYWSRIETTSSPESPPVEVNSAETVSAHVGITIKQITSLYYKKGSVTTGIEIKNIKTEFSDENTLLLLTSYNRTGNSPFLGTITTSLINSNNELISEELVSTTLYFNGTHRQELDISNIASGKYTIQTRFETSRRDVPVSDLVQMQPITETTTITIP